MKLKYLGTAAAEGWPASYAIGQSAQKLHLYGNEKCHALFKALCIHDEAPDDFESYVDFTAVAAKEIFFAGAYEITALKAVHDPRENCLLFAIKDPDGKRILYGNDTGSICEETWQLLRTMHFNLVSLDCTMGTQTGCFSHMSLSENTAVREKMLLEGCADESTRFVITHFSHGCCPLHEELAAIETEQGFLAAHDGLEIII